MTAFTAPSVVVGIDGSRAALQAALWAVDEAVGRELPLLLLAVRESAEDSGAEDLREAADAVAAAGRNLQVSTETRPGTAVSALVEASRSAVMVCIGAVGRRHGEHSRTGSTAAALAASAHCPVAVVRGRGSVGPGAGWVAVELDDSPDSAAVLQFAVDEARMRSAALRVIWPSVADENHPVQIRLDRRLGEWKHRYPDLDVAPVVARGTAMHYLTGQPSHPQLVVVGSLNTASVREFLGPAGLAALRTTSVLVIDPQRLL